MAHQFDAVVIGAGIFGLYLADLLAIGGRSVAIVEIDEEPFMRASLINQARLHLGYHYPRSITTGLPSAKYFHKFRDDYKFAIVDKFKKIYAISKRNSMTTHRRFEAFCKSLDIALRPCSLKEYFQSSKVVAAYETDEVAFDGVAIGQYMYSKLQKHTKIQFFFKTEIQSSVIQGGIYNLILSNGDTLSSACVYNTTYAGLNSQQLKFNFEPMPLKYELAELGLGHVSEKYKGVGITLMDGTFFSVMPWGDGSLHSISAVPYTPLMTSFSTLPTFTCMDERSDCEPTSVKNCNTCPVRPKTTVPWMIQLAKTYLRDDFEFELVQSKVTIKAILKHAEIDDSRPTLIQTFRRNPTYTAVLSGKINTIYDMEELLQ